MTFVLVLYVQEISTMEEVVIIVCRVAMVQDRVKMSRVVL